MRDDQEFQDIRAMVDTWIRDNGVDYPFEDKDIVLRGMSDYPQDYAAAVQAHRKQLIANGTEVLDRKRNIENARLHVAESVMGGGVAFIDPLLVGSVYVLDAHQDEMDDQQWRSYVGHEILHTRAYQFGSISFAQHGWARDSITRAVVFDAVDEAASLQLESEVFGTTRFTSQHWNQRCQRLALALFYNSDQYIAAGHGAVISQYYTRNWNLAENLAERMLAQMGGEGDEYLFGSVFGEAVSTYLGTDHLVDLAFHPFKIDKPWEIIQSMDEEQANDYIDDEPYHRVSFDELVHPEQYIERVINQAR